MTKYYDNLNNQPNIKHTDPEMWQLIQNEQLLQQNTLRMIASENYVSPAVREALSTVFTNKYAEGYPQKRYYQGQINTDPLEETTITRAKELFGADHANVQPYSGSPANLAAYLALAKPGAAVVGLGLDSGGHLTHGYKVNFSGQYNVDPKTELIDYEAFRQLCIKAQPEIVFIGTTSYSRTLDFKIFSEIAREVGAYLVADIAHVAGLVAAGVYNNPTPYADIVTMTTHKTLRGPRGGIALAKTQHAKKLDRAVFPGIQGGPHLNQIVALACALKEAKSDEFKQYAKNTVKNAIKLSQELTNKGLRIVSGGTDSHLLVVDLRPADIGGKTAAIALEKAGIICNFNAIPYDPAPPMNPSGIRLGTPCLTTRGLNEKHMANVADWIFKAIKNHHDDVILKHIADEINEFLNEFPVP